MPPAAVLKFNQATNIIRSQKKTLFYCKPNISTIEISFSNKISENLFQTFYKPFTGKRNTEQEDNLIGENKAFYSQHKICGFFFNKNGFFMYLLSESGNLSCPSGDMLGLGGSLMISGIELLCLGHNIF